MARPSAAKKSFSLHLLGMVAGHADQTVSVMELSKAVTFFVFHRILVKLHI